MEIQPNEGSAKERSAIPKSNPELLELHIPGIDDLSGLPRTEYEHFMRRVGVDVLKEASNLANGRVSGKRGKQLEFHSSHVEKAVALVSERGLARRKRPWWYTWGRITQGALTLTVTVSGALMASKDAPPAWGYVFVAAAATTILLSVVLEIADRSQK